VSDVPVAAAAVGLLSDHSGGQGVEEHGASVEQCVEVGVPLQPCCAHAGHRLMDLRHGSPGLRWQWRHLLVSLSVCVYNPVILHSPT